MFEEVTFTASLLSLFTLHSSLFFTLYSSLVIPGPGPLFVDQSAAE
ncbi:MAG: hypothetical protein KY459_07505 [Acidobacteria bacterium]|nr:hypothetical protein [Acidobacteriota bacterium]